VEVIDLTTRSSTVVATTLALFATVTSVVGLATLEPVWKGTTMMTPLEASDAGAAVAVAAGVE